MNRRTSNATTPRVFIVRIYRRTTHGIVGQVQDSLTGRVRAFRDFAELWAALGGRTQPPPSQDKESS
jgi:hypothetical protein